ncbi:MAG: MFS transporter [Rhodospirillaceae bacterium]|nr:MFS transporter [Rhodospirillaceae bacterium]
MGLFDGAYRPHFNSIIMHLCSPTERSRSYSLYLIGINVGFSVAGAVGGLLANVNYHYIFVVNGLLVAAAGLLMHQAIPASISLKEKQNHNKAVGEGGAAANPYKDFGFMLICISVLLSFLVSNQIGSTYSVYLTDFYHISPSSTG